MTRGHRFFDHTGDYGVEIDAPSLEAVFEESALAFTALVLERPVDEDETRAIALEGIDSLDLLVGLGNELLFLFEHERFATARLEVHALTEADENAHLEATVHGAIWPEDAPVARPMKAVTHHGAEVTATDEGLRARLIYDL